MDRGPIFIAGLERSGTTLLYALLASHPNIAMTRRTNFWRYFFNRFGGLSHPGNFERCLAAMMRYQRLLVLDPDWQRLREDFEKGEASYARLFALLEEQYARRLGKPRWGDKSLYTERYASLILQCYPTARIVHIIRDPRDRYASACRAKRIGRGKAAAGVAAWLSSVTSAKHNLARYPKEYKIVRYESLVLNPEETLRDICHFLGEEYTPAMLTMRGASGFRDKGGNSSFDRHKPGSISTSPVGRFRQVLSRRDLAFMQAFARYQMAAFDYKFEPVPFSLDERLVHYLIDWPVNFAYIAGWHALHAYHNRIGRAPSARRLLQ